MSLDNSYHGQRRRGGPPRPPDPEGRGGASSIHSLGEFGLIARLRSRLTGLGDDAAWVEPPSPGRLELLTADALVEGIHFRLSWMPARSLGWKALAVNLSDIAAMGGVPRQALVTLALPGGLAVEFVDGIFDGIISCAERYGCRVAGGDTVGSPGPVMVGVAITGEVERERLLTRSGAHPGDLLMVTGGLGAASAGLRALDAGLGRRPGWQEAIKSHLEPEPKLEEARALAASGAVTAAMDLSDGLASDLQRISEESQVGILLEVDRVPIHPACREVAETLGLDPLELAVAGGEDYQLLVAVKPEKAADLPVPLTQVGSVTPTEQGVRAVHADGRSAPLEPSFRHF